MELREWLIILGLVLVAIILVDGVRRLQRQRRGLRMDLSRDIDSSAPARDPQDIEREERMNWELPNGGARVVSGGEHEFDDRFDEPGMDTPDHDLDRARERDIDPAHDEYIDDERDMPAYRTHERHGSRDIGGSRDIEDSLEHEHEHDDEEMEALLPRRRDEFARRLKAAFPFGEGKRSPRQRSRPVEPPREKAPSIPERPAAREEAFDDDDPLFARHDRRDSPPEAFDFERDEDMASRDERGPDLEEEVAPARSQFDSARWASRHPVLERAARGMIEGESARTALAEAEEIVVISVMSRDEDGFHGPDLLQLVLACGLRLDDRGVFHRFETESSQSPLQFSMVNVVKPGTFDLEAMEEDATPGVTFLMPMPSAESSREAFEAMFETAMVLVRNLGGELKDENHSVMTAQTVEFARQRVHEFDRRWRLHHHQAH